MVAVRVRPFLAGEMRDGDECCVSMSAGTTTVTHSPGMGASTASVAQSPTPAGGRTTHHGPVDMAQFTFDRSYWSHSDGGPNEY
eukprot:gene9038-8163_t